MVFEPARMPSSTRCFIRGAILFGRSSVFCQSNISYCGRKAWGEITHQIVEEVACRRLARHTSFHRLLPVRDEYLDGTDQSGGLPDVDAEPWYVGEERCRPGKANSVSKRANTDSGDMLTLSLALESSKCGPCPPRASAPILAEPK